MKSQLMKSRLAVAAMAAAVLALGATAGRVRAAGPSPLPDFELTQLDGRTIPSRTAVPTQGKWLLVYVQARCAPCDRLLGLIKLDQYPFLPSRMLIVQGGASAADTILARQKFGDLETAQWYADGSRSAWTALQMSGVPMVFGMRDNVIEWSISGVFPSGDELKTILSSWVAE